MSAYYKRPPPSQEEITEASKRPTRSACPYCHVRKRVIAGKLEEHAATVVQIADDQRSTCTLTYRCPASGAEVSEWKDIK